MRRKKSLSDKERKRELLHLPSSLAQTPEWLGRTKDQDRNTAKEGREKNEGKERETEKRKKERDDKKKKKKDKGERRQ